MPFVAADWIATASNGNIRYIGDAHGGGSPSYSTTIEFHRGLQAFADDASYSGDDEIDITRKNPSERSTDNIITLVDHSGSGGVTYNIDQTASEHLYDGSIIQDGGDTIYDGFVCYSAPGTYLQIVQNGALATNFWTTGLNADAGSGISHRFMLRVRTGGADIDGRRLLGQTREWGKTFWEFPVAPTGRGNNTIALTYADDLNNQTIIGTVAGWTGITNTTSGYNGIDVNNDTTDEFYYSQWNTDNPTRIINDFYERMKWIQVRGTSTTLYGLNGELFRGITHEITVDTPTGTYNAFEAVSWPGGTGQMLAINSTTAATKMWIQLLTGVAPTDGQTITGGSSSATVDVNVTVTSRTVSFVMCGQSTGSAIIGAYGFGIEKADISSSDSVTALDGNPYSPPNFQSGFVTGLTVGEDYVIVANNDGGDIDFDFLSLNTTLNGATETAVVVTTTIPSYVPASGTIRIELDSGVYRRIAYTSYTGSTFTIASTSFTGANQATSTNNVFVTYVDTLATGTTEFFSGIYGGTPISMFIRVRDGGGTPKKQVETTASWGAAGFSVSGTGQSDA
jgi:hypothetical protein